MTKLPLLSGREAVKVLAKAGFTVDRQRGSHIILRREDPAPARTVVIPDHKEVDRRTLKSAIEQAGLTVEEFMKLLEE